MTLKHFTHCAISGEGEFPAGPDDLASVSTTKDRAGELIGIAEVFKLRPGPYDSDDPFDVRLHQRGPTHIAFPVKDVAAAPVSVTAPTLNPDDVSAYE